MQRMTLTTLAVTGMLGVFGCSDGKSDYKKTAELKKAPALHADHDHGEKGPHGGSIVELGKEEYHAEVVLDHDAHTLRVYVLGKDAKTAQATKATEVSITPHGKEALKLKPVPQKGDAEGMASQFELVDDGIVHGLLDAGAIHGELRVSIGDAPFIGEVDYHLDDVHHDHKDANPAADPAKEEAPKKDAAETPAATETTKEEK